MELIEKLGLDWRLLLAQIVNFFLLLFILRKFAYKPILEALQRRRDRIAEADANAEQIQKNLEDSEKSRERMITEARKEALVIVNHATAQTKTMQEAMMGEARKDVEKIVSDAHVEINAAREKMIADARGEIASLVVAAAGKVLEREVDEKENARMIDETLVKMAKK